MVYRVDAIGFLSSHTMHLAISFPSLSRNPPECTVHSPYSPHALTSIIRPFPPQSWHGSVLKTSPRCSQGSSSIAVEKSTAETSTGRYRSAGGLPHSGIFPLAGSTFPHDSQAYPPLDCFRILHAVMGTETPQQSSTEQKRYCTLRRRRN